MKKNIVLCISLVFITVALSFYMKKSYFKDEKELYFSQELTLKELAQRNDIPVKEILHVLSHEDRSVWEVSRIKPVKNLSINQDDLKDAIKHIKEEGGPLKDIIKYSVWAVWISLIILVILPRKRIQRTRRIILLFTVLIFGIIFGATPNPMESIVKLFKLFNGMEGDPKVLLVSFIIFTLFSLIGSKLICGWGCQLGALQESIFNIPIFKHKNLFKIPFAISLSLRLALFIVFLVLLFGFGYGVVIEVKNFVIYHHVNYFKVFTFHDIARIALYTLPLFIVASLFIYRPFCQFICPFGLYSWILENISLNRISIDETKCNKCEQCVKSCPTEAMKGIYKYKRKYFLPDCWACGNCIEACPTEAIHYKGKQ